MITVIDNYDSFTFNLVQMLSTFEPDLDVIRNDAITPEALIEQNPDGIVISPGPGRPEDAGIIVDLIQKAAGKIPILGICLGHQAIGAAYGGNVVSAGQLMHGKTSQARLVETSPLFRWLEESLTVGRYHSLCVDRDSLPDSLKITALSEEGTIMAMEDSQNDVYGIQFHPESILTPKGERILENFVRLCRQKGSAEHD